MKRISLSGIDERGELPLGLMEWEVTLWGGGGTDGQGNADEPVVLLNTLEEYRRMGLRNSVARSSAWGFFAIAWPLCSDGTFAKAAELRFLKMNTIRQV